MAPSVCILTTVHSTFDTRIFHKEAKTLVSAGYEVTLIVQHERNEAVEGIQVLALPKSRSRFHRMFGTTWKAFRLALAQSADVYHIHDPELLPVAALLKIVTRGKIIYDVHEDVPRQILRKHWIPKVLRHPVSIGFSLAERAFARLLDQVIPATQMVAHHFRHPRIEVIHNYPDLEMFRELPPSPKEREANRLVYIGGISRARGIVEMTKALDPVLCPRDVGLTLIGGFVLPELEQEVSELPGFRRVDYLGSLPWHDAWSLARGATAGLVLLHPGPNHTDNLPTKLFEYMAAELPVIASDFPLWREIVEGSQCGVTVDPLDPKAIAAAIEYLVANPEEAKQMGRNGRLAVEQVYNWRREAERMVSLYECILAESA